VDPFSQQPTCIVNLVSDKLDLDFLVHVDLGVGDEAAHKDVCLFDFHEIGSVSPADSLLLDLIPEPVVFLLEGQVSELLWTQANYLLVVNVHYGLLLPFELRFFDILGNLGIKINNTFS